MSADFSFYWHLKAFIEVCIVFSISIYCLSCLFWQLTVSYDLHFHSHLDYFCMGLSSGTITYKCVCFLNTHIDPLPTNSWESGNDWFLIVVWKEIDLINCNCGIYSSCCCCKARSLQATVEVDGWFVLGAQWTSWSDKSSSHQRVGQGELGWNLNLILVVKTKSMGFFKWVNARESDANRSWVGLKRAKSIWVLLFLGTLRKIFFF